MSEPTEAEILARFIDAMRTAEGCARQMGHSRKDQRWIKVCGLLTEVQTKAALLAASRLAS